MLLTQLVKKDFSCLKMVVFYLIHIIAKKVMKALLVFVDIKFQSKCFTKSQIQKGWKKITMVGH